MIKGVMEGSGVITYADDILIGGAHAASHDEAVKRVLHKVQKYDIRANASKMCVAERRVLFLGCDIERSRFHLTTYVAHQWKRLPKMTETRQLRWIIELFNVFEIRLPPCG